MHVMKYPVPSLRGRTPRVARFRALRCRAALAALAFLLTASRALAYDGFTSEFSHAVGGATMAGVATAAADRCGARENRAWIGFGVASTLGLVAEANQMARNQQTSRRSAALDVGSNMLGAAIGAWSTDRYVLAPVVEKDAAGRRAMVGLVLHAAF